MQNGNTPLHIAATNKNKDCTELLLSHGAFIHIKNNVSHSVAIELSDAIIMKNINNNNYYYY